MFQEPLIVPMDGLSSPFKKGVLFRSAYDAVIIVHMNRI